MALTATVAVAGTAVFVAAEPASAWKPYTHNFTGDNAWVDAVGDPQVLGGGGDGLDPAEAIHSKEVYLDTTPPTCTCDTPPFQKTFDSDDVSTVDFELADGRNGSGVASHSALIDGFPTAPEATTPTDDGQGIDMYLFYPGVRTVTVTGTDSIGNTAKTGARSPWHRRR